MAHAFLLQDWTTLKTGTTISVTQGADDYADLVAYQDINVFLEVAEVTTAQVSYQTSPTKDDNLSINMAAALAPSVGVSNTPLRYATATMPLARYFRWKWAPSGAAGMSVTFRIWASPNPS